MERIEVRATVNLPGVSHGQVVEVDPSDPYMAGCLRKGLLVREGHEPAEGVDNRERLPASE